MQINGTRKDSVLALALEGRLDTLTSPELENSLKDSLSGIDSLVLNFSKVDYVSSAGLRALLSAHKLTVALYVVYQRIDTPQSFFVFKKPFSSMSSINSLIRLNIFLSLLRHV